MKYALAKFRVYLLGDRPFTVFTDHASLRTAVNSPHLSQRMARWLSFFAEYNFSVEYKPGRLNVVADALSRRPDYEPTPSSKNSELNAVGTLSVSVPTSSILDDVRDAYAHDERIVRLKAFLMDPSPEAKRRLPASYRSTTHRYTQRNGLLYYNGTPRVVVPESHDLRLRIMYECHDAPVSGHRGREKTYLTLSRDFYWPRQYQFVRKYVRACEVCQRVKPGPSLRAPLQSLPIPTECWESVSMDFIFGFPEDEHKNDGILVFVDRFSKMVHLAAVPETITAEGSARVFVDTVFRLHGLPRELVSDRDPRFTAEFWRSVFRLVGTRLKMSTSDHPETDGQTERTNRVLEEILRGYVHSFSSWSDFLPMVEFAINNSVHASTSHTPFYVNGLRHPRLPPLLESDSSLREGGTRSSTSQDGSRSSSVDDAVDTVANDDPVIGQNDDDASESSISDDEEPDEGDHALVDDEEMDISAVRASRTAAKQAESAGDFLLTRQAVVRFVQDSIADSVDRQKRNADKNGRANVLSFNEGDLVLLSTTNLPTHAVTNVGSSKLLPKYVGPFRVLRRMGSAYTLELPRRMRTHPTFYVGRLRPYHRHEPSSVLSERPHAPGSHGESYSAASESPALTPSSDAAASAQPDRRAGSQRPAPEPSDLSAPVRDHDEAVQPRRVEEAESPPIHPVEAIFPPPPPPLTDSHGNELWIVEGLLNHRDRQDGTRTKYLVR
jgi:hypothetical protein